MKNESIYKNYIPNVINPNPSNINSYWFIFKDNKILINPSKKSIDIIPKTNTINFLEKHTFNTFYLGTLFNIPCYCCEISSDVEKYDTLEFVGLRSLFTLIPEDIFMLVGKAHQLVNWKKDNKFCGRCGTITEKSNTEYAIKCPNCSNTVYTRISPAIITAVIKNGKILLANAAKNYKNGMYSLIAGFLEPGETLEECVKREVYEEVGIEIKNIKYFSNQPWPFPDSLMIGFIAEYKSGKIKVDGKEILKADWFTP